MLHVQEAAIWCVENQASASRRKALSHLRGHLADMRSPSSPACRKMEQRLPGDLQRDLPLPLNRRKIDMFILKADFPEFLNTFKSVSQTGVMMETAFAHMWFQGHRDATVADC